MSNFRLSLNGFDYKQGRNSDEVRLNCPFCLRKRGKEDTDFCLGLNIKTKKFRCFKCDSNSGNTSFKFLENLDLYKEEMREWDDMLDLLNKPRGPYRPEDIDLDRVSDPLDAYDTPIAYAYATLTRGLSDADCKRLNLRVGKPYWRVGRDGTEYEDRRWCGRLIFPFMENGAAKFLVGRTYTNATPKYMNSDDRKKDAYVYGLDRVRDGKAILCEGIISSLAAEKWTGVAGLSALGYFLTDIQLVKIQTRVDTLYVCLDGGVSQEVRKKLRGQIRTATFRKVYEIQLPEKADPDDLQAGFVPYFNSAVELEGFF